MGHGTFTAQIECGAQDDDKKTHWINSGIASSVTQRASGICAFEMESYSEFNNHGFVT